MRSRVGSRDKRISVQRAIEVADSAGGSTVTWGIVDTFWASILPGDGREFWEQKRLLPTLSHVVTIRYRTGLTPAMRVVWGTRVFAILVVRDPDERGTALELLCEEEVAT